MLLNWNYLKLFIGLLRWRYNPGRIRDITHGEKLVWVTPVVYLNLWQFAVMLPSQGLISIIQRSLLNSIYFPLSRQNPMDFSLGVPRKFGTNTWRCLLAVCSTGPAEVAFIIKMMFAEKGQPSQTGPVLIIQCDVQSLGKASTLK